MVCFSTPSAKILQVALKLKADLIFMELRRSTYVAGVSYAVGNSL